MINLNGRISLVTGGSRGIGKAIVETLVGAGGHVILQYGHSIQAATEISERLGHDRCYPIAADLNQPAAIPLLWERAVSWRGRIDVLVNNASTRRDTPAEADYATWDADWMETLRVNLVSPAHLCRLAVSHFTDQGGGRIINIASRPAFRGDTPTAVHDGAAKGGLISLTRSIARWHGKSNVLAYAVVPGMIKTQQLDEFIKLYGEDYAKHDIPLGEFGKPQDIANVVAFLASDLARYATGATIDVNGACYVH